MRSWRWRLESRPSHFTLEESAPSDSTFSLKRPLTKAQSRSEFGSYRKVLCPSQIEPWFSDHLGHSLFTILARLHASPLDWPDTWIKFITYRVEPGYDDIGFTRHLAYSVRYPVVPINSSLLTITLHCSVITTENIQPLSGRYNRVRLSLEFLIKIRSLTGRV
jgi:hypothetical protein